TQLMQNILTAESFKEIQLILNEISLIDKAGIEDWLQFYNQLWVLASLSQHCSKVNSEIWYIVGKELSLMNTIEKAQKLDMRKYINCEIQDKYGVAKTGQNNEPISHALQSVK
ncbi:7481_t:CDS:2, partial [Racocetra persica]